MRSSQKRRELIGEATTQNIDYRNTEMLRTLHLRRWWVGEGGYGVGVKSLGLTQAGLDSSSISSAVYQLCDLGHGHLALRIQVYNVLIILSSLFEVKEPNLKIS